MICNVRLILILSIVIMLFWICVCTCFCECFESSCLNPHIIVRQLHEVFEVKEETTADERRMKVRCKAAKFWLSRIGGVNQDWGTMWNHVDGQLPLHDGGVQFESCGTRRFSQLAGTSQKVTVNGYLSIRRLWSCRLAELRRSFHTEKHEKTLKKRLHLLESWCEDNSLSLNVWR